MKTCNKCNLQKELTNFSKNKSNKDGFLNFCKECCKKESRKIKNKVFSIYLSQKLHSKKRGHNPPEYSKQEFLEWCIKNQTFQTLYKNWVESGFKKGLAPSIDRIDDYKTYSFDNIRICTWGENLNKGHSDRLFGINNKGSKAVLQFDLDGNFIKEYHSISQTARETGISIGNICSVCKNKRFKAGNFKFKYKK